MDIVDTYAIKRGEKYLGKDGRFYRDPQYALVLNGNEEPLVTGDRLVPFDLENPPVLDTQVRTTYLSTPTTEDTYYMLKRDDGLYLHEKGWGWGPRTEAGTYHVKHPHLVLDPEHRWVRVEIRIKEFELD